MGKRYRKKTNVIHASDAEGKAYEILEFTEYEVVPSFGGKTETVELLKNYQTSDGFPVNRINEDDFDVLCFDVRTGRDKIRVQKNKP